MNKKIIAAAIAGLALTGALAFGTTVSAADERRGCGYFFGPFW